MSPSDRGKFVAYYRVSTQQQGRSGLGLDAQRAAVAQFLNGGAWTLLKEFTEVESGKRADRPELAKALNLCKVSGARLVIAKLDRLSRNAAFLLTLRDTGVKFVACDMPDATELTVGILAVVAQDEARRISQRTKDALAAAKAQIAEKGFRISTRGRRYTRLGNPNGAAALLRAGTGHQAAAKAIKTQADARARDLVPMLEDIEHHGIVSHRGIAAELTVRGIPSPRGRAWNEWQVARLRRRLRP